MELIPRKGVVLFIAKYGYFLYDCLMNTLLFILVGLVGLLAISVVAMFFALKKKPEEKNDGQLLLLQNQLQKLTETMDTKLGESQKSMQIQFGQSAKIISDVTEQLTKLSETNKQVVGFADQLQSLQDILQNPKRRGVLGEYYLETVLKNVLPPSVYEMQYKVGKDDKGADLVVDAAIFLQDKIIPIDSKFSLENYTRIIECKEKDVREKLEKAFKQDLKNRIDETAKYIQPKNGTMDFALMFIPSEAIYYDLLINKVGDAGVNAADLIEYAGKKRVNIVSPNSFYAFLQTILQGLKQMQIQKSTQEIIKRVGDLDTHIRKYDEYMKKLGGNLSTTVNAYNVAHKEFKKIDKDVVKISGVERELLDEVQVERPEEEAS